MAKNETTFCPGKMYVKVPLGWRIAYVTLADAAMIEKLLSAQTYDNGWDSGQYLIPNKRDAELEIVRGEDIIAAIENGVRVFEKREAQRKADDEAKAKAAAEAKGEEHKDQPF